MTTEPPDNFARAPSKKLVNLTAALIEGKIDQATYDRLRADYPADSEVPPVRLGYEAPAVREPSQPVLVSIVRYALLLLPLSCVFTVFLSPKQVPSKARIQVAEAAAEVRSLAAALAAFGRDCGRYPTSAEGLAALVEVPANAPGWRGPYVRVIPLDSWANPYFYICPGAHNGASFDLFSMGPDVTPGTADDIGN